MKKSISIILIIISFLTQPSFSQWQITNGPSPGSVGSIAVSGNHIYSAGGTTLSLSTNNGDSWTIVASGLGSIYTVATKGTDVFMGVGNSVYQSSNSGGNWTNTSSGLPSYFINSLTVYNNIYTATFGVYVSSNNGLLWSKLNQSWNAFVNDIAVNNSTIIAATMNNGIYISEDNGVNWNQINTGIPSQVNAVAIVGTNYLAGTNSGIYISSNSGLNWNLTNVTAAISCFLTIGNNVLAGSGDGGGVFHSMNFGLNWNSINTGLTSLNVSSLATDNNYLFAGTSNKVWKRPLSEFLPFSVSTSSNPIIGGTTTGDGNYLPNSSVTVTAIPNSSYTFSNWTENGTIVSSNSNYVFNISDDRNLIANFSVIIGNYTVTTSAYPLTGGTTNGDGSYSPNSSVTVDAMSNPGFKFSNWNENGIVVSNDSSYAFTITEDRNLIAEFSISTSIRVYENHPLLKIYPNPSIGNLFISADKDYNLDVYNSKGKKIFSSYINEGKTELSLNEKGDMLFIFERNGQERIILKQIISE